LAFFETRSHFVAEDGFELMLFLLQPPQCWDYRYVPSCPALIFFSIKAMQIKSEKLSQIG
jgi:hypothetical protein